MSIKAEIHHTFLGSNKIHIKMVFSDSPTRLIYINVLTP